MTGQNGTPHRPVPLKPGTSRCQRVLARYRRYLTAASIVPIIAAGLLFGRGLGDDTQTSAGFAVLTEGPPLVASDAWVGPERTGRPAPEQTPAPVVEEGEQESAVPHVPFHEYEVAEGDTLGSIAAAFGVEVEHLLWNNPLEVQDPDMLLIGQKLVVPAAPGIVYYVEIGDTLNSIAERYGIDPEAVVAFEGNGIESADLIVEGEPLLLPGAESLLTAEMLAGEPPEVEETVSPSPTPEPVPEPTAAPDPGGPRPAAAGDPVPAPQPADPPAVSAGFIWPVSGPINSGFGPRWGSVHTGIDIGASYGTAVGAAGSGQVVLTVFSDAGYGNYIVIRHGDGSRTLYAHLSEIWVTNGQRVGQGESVGAVGCSGWCTGSHLHFEVRIGGVPVNPLLYLP